MEFGFENCVEKRVWYHQVLFQGQLRGRSRTLRASASNFNAFFYSSVVIPNSPMFA